MISYGKIKRKPILKSRLLDMAVHYSKLETVPRMSSVHNAYAFAIIEPWFLLRELCSMSRLTAAVIMEVIYPHASRVTRRVSYRTW